jgi:hypothetical protein
MRSSQIHRALDQIPNRFALCMSISRGVRLTHKNGTSMGSTVTSMIAGIESREFLRVVEAPIPALIGSLARVFPRYPSLPTPAAWLAT